MVRVSTDGVPVTRRRIGYTGFMNSLPVVVVIGRNEGIRLVRCLESITAVGAPFVYVDSGSVDESVKNAAKFHPVATVELAPPYSASAARNAGFAAARKHSPLAPFVQFLDGDCLLEERWLATAVAFLTARPRCAAVVGRRSEQHPTASIFNDACNVEWGLLGRNRPWCSGDMLLRGDVFAEIGGYKPVLLCGEEADLLGRMELLGYTAESVDVPMSRHDADIRTWGQWARRAQRAGLAVSLAVLHYPPNLRTSSIRGAVRPAIWAGLLPAAIALAWFLDRPDVAVFLLPCCLWPVGRGTQAARESGQSWASSLRYGIFCLLDKGPMFWGEITFVLGRLRNRAGGIIEYK